MDLELSDDQQELQAQIHAVLERERPVAVTRRLAEESDGADDAVRALWSRLVELDWAALTVGEEHGGVGLGPVELCVLAEELGRALTPGPLLATVSQFVPVVRAAGSEEQQARFLGAVARERLSGTLAVAEADGRFDPEGVRCEARPAGAGHRAGAWQLDGTKHFVVEAGRADEVVVVARTADRGEGGRLGLFVVPSDADGLEVVAVPALDAGTQLCTVALHGVVVAADRVLDPPGGGEAALTAALEEATMAQAAETLGTCQAIMDIVLEHVKTREQFGVKIGSFQAVKHKLADMYVATEAARALTYFAAACIAENDERRPLAVSMAKSSVADCQKLVATEGIQCLGGIGYTWEHDMHLYVKGAKSGAALFGTGAEHRARVATAIGI